MVSFVTAFLGRKAKLVLVVSLCVAAMGAAGAVGWLTAPVA